MSGSPATSTVERAVGPVVAAFGVAAQAAIDDASAIFRTIYGVDDGNDYGRYFAGQSPLVPYVAAATSIDGMIAQGIALRVSAAQMVAAAVAGAGDDPGDFATEVFAVCAALRAACSDPQDALRLFAGLAQFTFTVDGGADAIGMQIAALSASAAVLMRRAAGITYASATADYLPSSQQDAVELRDAAYDLLDNLILEAADRFEDASASALSSLRLAVVQDLTQRGASLAPVRMLTLPAPVSALVEAYRLYQDATRADELIARNDPPHPGFLPVAVEVAAF